MTIEPHAVTTVSRRPLLPTEDQARSLADYQDNVADRFGHGKMPPWSELARRENRMMRRHMGISPMARDQWDKTGHSEEAMAKIVQAAHRRGEAITLRAVTFLTKPMTMAELARASGMPETTTKKALERALESGRVIKRKLKSMTIWEPRQEAAE